ncbi:large subunit ribosomal protein L25 [Anaerosolibacter carboniphilus]|uniref:Large ribosomal subunit protein bL25 n=1 Tax=Anaerosolibacter carboniphilus TaxID=1417629 RepID=A0A841L6V4_9FIRM|nr:50S ribosomal protein L25 [Anaerosolibacter carboniphilus]MBB6218812.1 large subunit ribosomal protein L25 [Anaerosolibacter carboniphilus]
MFKSSMHADLRSEVGSNACHRVRNTGHIPGVVYGHHIATRLIEIDRKEIDTILREHGTNVFLSLDMDGRDSTVLIKEIQRHPVSHDIIHMDFQEISNDKKIHTTVPIILRGREKVETKNSVVQHQLRELHIECLPQHVPNSIELDITMLSPNHPLRIADMEFGMELTVLNEANEVIASLARAEKVIDDPGEEEK